ncbi:MAG TPA: YdcF family protein [Candidatus Paceibacterota bacterium]|nr:YdcF family protein [Verrucomicrobiota bacterium]HRY46504.1 YdcF family protein [Candidatus Paceibacterota bacterium]HSA01495.1 YdcF family protein [Candidatus Paceibacterota bacterium]
MTLLPEEATPLARQTCCCGFFTRKTVWVPAPRAILSGVLLGLLLLFLAQSHLHSFLAVSNPVPARCMVIEGWLPDYAMVAAVREFKDGGYDCLFATGLPLDRGHFLVSFQTYADLAAATCLRLGLSSNQVIAVPAERVERDRTYCSALALKQWLVSQNRQIEALNVVSLGAHSRRTWLSFRKVLAPETRVGILSMPNREYDAAAWWRSSEGFKEVLAEVLGFFYLHCCY